MRWPHDFRRKETIVTVVFFAVILMFSLNYVKRLVTAPPPGRTHTAPPPPAASGFPLRDTLVRLDAQAESIKASVDDFIEVETPLWIRFSELNMRIRKWAGMKLVPGDWTVVELPNGHFATYRGPADTVRCARELIRFRDFVEEQDTHFLFVMIPYKDARLEGQMPADYPDFVSRNVRRFLKRLKRSQVPLLDLKPALMQENTDYFSHFFRTDHHWKPEVGLWAAGAIAAELQRRYGVPFDPQTLDPARFHVEVHEKALLGSFGRKVTLAYAAPEDFSVISPVYPTDFTVRIPGTSIDRRGPFADVMFKIQDDWLAARDYYKGNPFAYMYGNRALIQVHNHLRDDGRRMLIIKDSFSNFVTPFQALTTEYLDIIDLRHFTASLEDYIRETRPDLVLVQYNAEIISTSTRRRKARKDMFLFD